MLFSEMVRIIKNEDNLIKDDTKYVTTSTSWATLKDYGNITLAEDGFVIFSFQLRENTAAQTAYVRLKIGSYYIRGDKVVGTTWTTITGMCWLAAGTYGVLLEGMSSSGSYQCEAQLFQLGKCKFSDRAGSPLNVYSSAINLTAPSARKLAVGTIKNVTYLVTAFAYTSGAVTNFESVGDNLTNGVSITLDGVQKSWDYRFQDADSKGHAYARVAIVLSPGTSHAIVISKRNQNTVVHISVIACPWLLSGSDNEVITLDFPQGSTFYLIMEPLFDNPTKYSKIGKKRAISFGDATDYYSTASGQNILSHNYTFEIVEVTNSVLLVSGYGGCVSIVGIDVR